MSAEANQGWLEKLAPQTRGFVEKLLTLPDPPLEMARLALALRTRERETPTLAQELAERAWLLAAHDPRVRQVAEWAIRRRVPGWHFPLVHDVARNTAYRQALQRFVKPGMIVLEIGAGTGLLAMMAARAGAGHVYTCEMEPLLATVAQENVAHNQLADRVTVIPKRSNDLVVGVDLPELADLLVSEIVSSDLLSERILPTLRDAQDRLLKPGAPILPAAVASRGVLVGGPAWANQCRVATVEELDLTALNRFTPSTLFAVLPDRPVEDSLSEPADVARFDFQARSSFPDGQRVVPMTVRRAGLAEGLLQWLRLEFADDLVHDNQPPAPSAWGTLFHVFPRPLPVQAGQSVSLVVEHKGNMQTLWPA
jgi:type II protein arginine methyltransferase